MRVLLVCEHEALRHGRDRLSVLEDNVSHAQTDGCGAVHECPVTHGELSVYDHTVAHVTRPNVAHLLLAGVEHVRAAQERRNLLVASLSHTSHHAHACSVVRQGVGLILVGHVRSVSAITRTLLDVETGHLRATAADAEAEKCRVVGCSV